MKSRIKVLFLAASPADGETLRSGEQARKIFDEIELATARDAFDIIHHFAVRPTDLQRLLLRHQPNVVHFSGRGTEGGEILFEDDRGESAPVDGEVLARVFELHKGNIRLVFLNACFSLSRAGKISSVIDYTVGTRKAIGERASTNFAAAFYRALAFERSVSFAFESGRAELDLLKIPEGDVPQLLVRSGVETEKPFLSILENDASEEVAALKAALLSLTANRANDEEKELSRRALVNGRLVLEQAEGSTETESGVRSILDGMAGTAVIHLTLGESIYRRIQEQLYPSPAGLPPALPGLMFVGREESLSDIKGLLGIGKELRESSNLTIVRGWPGVGKTTMVGVLARDAEVAVAFPQGVLWTALEQKPDLMSKIAQWGRWLGTDDLIRIPLIDEAVERLGRLLRSRRMLLIVDDIWNAADALPFIQAAAGTDCAVLATTRLTSVADQLAKRDGSLSTENIYLLPVLTEENALILLRYLAPEVVDAHAEACQELVRDLECLPLALHVAGRLLKAEAKMGLDVADLINGIRRGAKLLPEPAPLDRAEGATIPTVGALLQRSTDNLDERTRECFAYLGVFAPKPATFDVEAMKAVWMVDDPKPMIRKLVGHGLLEPVGSGRFQIHALLVQHANSLLS